jgi:putative membrane protein
MLSNRFTRIALVGGAIAFAACAKDKSTTTDSAAGSMNRTDTAASMNNSSATSGGAMNANTANTANTGAPAMTDANIVAYLDAANMVDSAAGKLASTKGTSKDVQSFGKMMMGEHHALREQGQALAKKNNITPEAASNDTTKAMGEHTSAQMTSMAKGAAWDKAYIDHEVAVHQSVLDNAKAAHDATQNAELKTLIEKASPVIQKHLDRAKEIQKKLSPAT